LPHEAGASRVPSMRCGFTCASGSALSGVASRAATPAGAMRPGIRSRTESCTRRPLPDEEMGRASDEQAEVGARSPILSEHPPLSVGGDSHHFGSERRTGALERPPRDSVKRRTDPLGTEKSASSITYGISCRVSATPGGVSPVPSQKGLGPNAVQLYRPVEPFAIVPGGEPPSGLPKGSLTRSLPTGELTWLGFGMYLALRLLRRSRPLGVSPCESNSRSSNAGAASSNDRVSPRGMAAVAPAASAGPANTVARRHRRAEPNPPTLCD